MWKHFWWTMEIREALGSGSRKRENIWLSTYLQKIVLVISPRYCWYTYHQPPGSGLRIFHRNGGSWTGHDRCCCWCWRWWEGTYPIRTERFPYYMLLLMLPFSLYPFIGYLRQHQLLTGWLSMQRRLNMNHEQQHNNCCNQEEVWQRVPPHTEEVFFLFYLCFHPLLIPLTS